MATTWIGKRRKRGYTNDDRREIILSGLAESRFALSDRCAVPCKYTRNLNRTLIHDVIYMYMGTYEASAAPAIGQAPRVYFCNFVF